MIGETFEVLFKRPLGVDRVVNDLLVDVDSGCLKADVGHCDTEADCDLSDPGEPFKKRSTQNRRRSSDLFERPFALGIQPAETIGEGPQAIMARDSATLDFQAIDAPWTDQHEVDFCPSLRAVPHHPKRVQNRPSVRESVTKLVEQSAFGSASHLRRYCRRTHAGHFRPALRLGRSSRWLRR